MSLTWAVIDANAACWRWRFGGSRLAGLELTRIYRSQELRTEMGSMLQVLFRFQLQPFLINWLLSSPANWGSAFDQWPHTQMGSHLQKHSNKHTFTLLDTHTHRQTYAHTHVDAKPSKCVWSMPIRPVSRIRIISCSVVLIDHRIKWLVKESLRSLLFSFLLTPSLLEFICKEKHLSLNESVILVLILKHRTGMQSRSLQLPVACYDPIMLCIFTILSFSTT